MISIDSQKKIKFGSKAETLAQINNLSLSCTIPPFTFFSRKDWRIQSASLLEKISKSFQPYLVAVRSSAACEDGIGLSNAGAFESILNINPDNTKELREAIEKVFASYPEQDEADQVLVQQMVTGIAVSGVILTRFVDDGSPYYVLNYDDETGRTDSITGGTGVHKTVMVYRKYKEEYFDSPRVRKMLALAQEIEEICGWVPLDIEFAIDHDGSVYLLQVRRISTVGGWHPDTEHRVSRVIPQVERFIEHLSARRKGLFGASSIFGNMPDWNPAELIGPIPSPLAASLFRKLISSNAWSVARAQIGYHKIPRTELMVLIGGRAYIDVRASFNSFLPKGIPEEIGEKLINAWLARLSANPSLHDKVEFEVAHTVLDFTFDTVFAERYGDVLTPEETCIFKACLQEFTNNALDMTAAGSLPKALSRIDSLAEEQSNGALEIKTESPVALAAFIADLLEDCIQYGTIPFTIIARHGFIAETLLRSAIQRGAITRERVAEFKSSFNTIMGELARDTQAVCEGRLDEAVFHERYGHLRPGTFDIMSPCYRDRPDLFDNCNIADRADHQGPFTLTDEEEQAINTLLQKAGVGSIDAEGLFAYAQAAICGREYGKFVFSRNLSAALEAIASWGEFYTLGREDLSYLTIDDIIDSCYTSTRDEMTSVLMQKVDQARIGQSFAKLLKLSYLIRGVRDIHVVPIHRSEPNFITQKKIERPCKFLDATTLNSGSLKDYIICIDNADPGFDWIFSKGIAGLITKYGGANSHMAIRCAELQLPAAIGCGEDLFERLRNCRKIVLNCESRVIRPLGYYEG
ncbi:PEP/pyruvate-binding domain-containing protein [Methanocalculus natronophilus]|uniref:PEP/pyruvate-binding domain-containing protein n=1 Tax=Methanocalculus natronophilus TaxID=1262400 RepID=UPI0031B609F7